MQVVRERRVVRRGFLDFNLLPPGYRPRFFPLVSVSLGVLAAAAFLLLIAIYQIKFGADADVVRLQSSLQETQRRLGELSQPAPPAAGQDGLALAGSRIGWSRVLQSVIASLPADVRIQDVAFAADSERGPQAIVKGEAAEYAAVVEYADNLRSSPLFSRVTIQSMAQGTTFTNTTATPVGPGGSLPGAVPALPTPTKAAVAVPTATRVPPMPVLVQPTPTPTATRTPTFAALLLTPTIDLLSQGTPTATATPTPATAAYDFVVVDTEQTYDEGAPYDVTADFIAGKVFDMDGQTPMSGIGVRVTSIDAVSPWSADTTTDGSGYWRFALTKAKFKVQVLAGSSQVANELWVGATNQPGAYYYFVTFRKNRPGTPVVPPTGTPTITRTPTVTSTPTPPSPIGTVIAGTASAPYNGSDAWKAVDGDTNTAWNSGKPPDPYYAYWEETFDGPHNVSGITLVVSQSPEGSTTHTVRFYNSSGAEVSNFTLSGHTYDGQVLNRPLSSALTGVTRVRIETTASPSFVAWREVMVYTVDGPTATPTSTPTITATPTPTASPTPRGQSSDAWRYAYPLALNDPQSRTFYNTADKDWAKIRIETLGSYTIRVQGGSGVDADLELNQYLEATDSITYIDYNDNACGSDPLLARSLSADTTYYMKIQNNSGTTGTYTITVSSGTLTCATSAVPASSMLADGAGPGAGSPATALAATGAELASSRGPGRAAPAFALPGAPSEDNLAAPWRRAVGFIVVLDISPERGQ